MNQPKKKSILFGALNQSINDRWHEIYLKAVYLLFCSLSCSQSCGMLITFYLFHSRNQAYSSFLLFSLTFCSFFLFSGLDFDSQQQFLKIHIYFHYVHYVHGDSKHTHTHIVKLSPVDIDELVLLFSPPSTHLGIQTHCSFNLTHSES